MVKKGTDPGKSREWNVHSGRSKRMGRRAGLTGAFGVPGENDNGRRVMEFCAERGLCVGNTYFEHRSLHNYTRVAGGQDGVEVKNMIDLVLVKRDI